jgi:hypothetical protein
VSHFRPPRYLGSYEVFPIPTTSFRLRWTPDIPWQKRAPKEHNEESRTAGVGRRYPGSLIEQFVGTAGPL